MSIAPKHGIHEAITASIAASIAAHPATARIGQLLAIDRESAGQLLGAMREIAFPGFHLMGGAEAARRAPLVVRPASAKATSAVTAARSAKNGAVASAVTSKRSLPSECQHCSLH